jgi:hypothetical protein
MTNLEVGHFLSCLEWRRSFLGKNTG